MKNPIFLLFILLFACQMKETNLPPQSTIDVQGHRGARGLYPENTIPAFIHAIDIGVRTLELDVVISADKEVVVSHEPFFNHEISRTPQGEIIPQNMEKRHNIFEMTLKEVQAYDVGLHPHHRFPEQKKMKAVKPSLKEMVQIIEQKVIDEDKALPYYNIEIKRKAEYDTIYHPGYKEFADIVITTIEELGISNRTTVQCFDIETLQYLHDAYPDVALVYLIENTNPFKENIEKLGFKPAVYSPYYQLVSEELITYCQEHQIKCIPWTVNKEEDMKKLIKMGVDGIISDYPNRLIAVVK